MFSRIINLTSFYVNRLLNKVEDPAAALSAEHQRNLGSLATMQQTVLSHHAERIKLQHRVSQLTDEALGLEETLAQAKTSGQNDIARDAARSLVAVEDELEGVRSSLNAVIAIGDELEKEVHTAQVAIANQRTEGTLLLAQHNAAKASLEVRRASTAIGGNDVIERLRDGVLDTTSQIAAIGEMESRGSLGTGVTSNAALQRRLNAVTTSERIEAKLALPQA
jgi:phage shock protein A